MRKFPSRYRKAGGEAAILPGSPDLLNASRGSSRAGSGSGWRLACYRRHPQVFLFDEPLSTSTPSWRANARGVERLHERLETTAIYVTHDQVEAMTLGDRVVVMKDGTVQQWASPLEVTQAGTSRGRLHRLPA